MPKTLDPSHLSLLLERIGRFADGVGIEPLLRALRHKLSRRTLQRRLALLVADKRLEMHGVSRQITYRLPARSGSLTAALGELTLEASAELYVPLRPESEALMLQVRRPLALRKPVGYSTASSYSTRMNRTSPSISTPRCASSCWRSDARRCAWPRARLSRAPSRATFSIGC